MIRSVSLSDAQSICEIYNYYIADTVISFEEEDVSASEMKERNSRKLYNALLEE